MIFCEDEESRLRQWLSDLHGKLERIKEGLSEDRREVKLSSVESLIAELYDRAKAALDGKLPPSDCRSSSEPGKLVYVNADFDSSSKILHPSLWTLMRRVGNVAL